jgi:hypothetical protein
MRQCTSHIKKSWLPPKMRVSGALQQFQLTQTIFSVFPCSQANRLALRVGQSPEGLGSLYQGPAEEHSDMAETAGGKSGRIGNAWLGSHPVTPVPDLPEVFLKVFALIGKLGECGERPVRVLKL